MRRDGQQYSAEQALRYLAGVPPILSQHFGILRAHLHRWRRGISQRVAAETESAAPAAVDYGGRILTRAGLLPKTRGG